jgi:hypothetical protein
MATIRQKGPEQWHAQTAGRYRPMSNAYLMSARNRSAVPFTARKGTRAPKYHQHSRIPGLREFDWSANRPSAKGRKRKLFRVEIYRHAAIYADRIFRSIWDLRLA